MDDLMTSILGIYSMQILHYFYYPGLGALAPASSHQNLVGISESGTLRKSENWPAEENNL